MMDHSLILRPSENFDERPVGAKIKYLIYHYTAVDLETSLKLLCEPSESNPVSAHYLICEEGRIFQLVPEEMRAWHAGISSWGEDRNINATSIGIELVNLGDHPFSEAQMRSLKNLSHELLKKNQIHPFNSLGNTNIVRIGNLIQVVFLICQESAGEWSGII